MASMRPCMRVCKHARAYVRIRILCMRLRLSEAYACARERGSAFASGRAYISMLEYVCRPIRVCGSAFVLIPVFVRTCMRVVLCAP